MEPSRNSIVIRRATTLDIPAVMEIVSHTIDGMKQMGNDQWDGSYPKDDRFQTDIGNGALYVATLSDEVIAFITIDDEQAIEYTAMQWLYKNPIVMHRLAVHPLAQGTGVARLLETFTQELAIKSGKDSIRLDTHSTNAPMQAFLSSLGYTKIGEMDYRGKSRPFFCYEKAVASK